MIDEEFNFADCLERQALKRSANEEVYKEILQLFQEILKLFHGILQLFQEISKLFQEEMNKEEFLQRNAKNFGKGKYKPLQVDTKKLQAKYNAIKRKWREIKDRP